MTSKHVNVPELLSSNIGSSHRLLQPVAPGRPGILERANQVQVKNKEPTHLAELITNFPGEAWSPRGPCNMEEATQADGTTRSLLANAFRLEASLAGFLQSKVAGEALVLSFGLPHGKIGPSMLEILESRERQAWSLEARVISNPPFATVSFLERLMLSGPNRAMQPRCAMRFESQIPKSLAMRKSFFFFFFR